MEHEYIKMPEGGWGEHPPRLVVTNPAGEVETAAGSFLAVYRAPDGEGWHVAIPHAPDADPAELISQAVMAVVRVLLEEGGEPAGVRLMALLACARGVQAGEATAQRGLHA